MSAPTPTIDEPGRIVACVAREAHVSPWLIRSGSRRGFVAEARAAVCLLMRDRGWGLQTIAEQVGLASRSSVHELIERHRFKTKTRNLADAARTSFCSETPATSNPDTGGRA